MSTFKPVTISYLWNRDNFEKSFEQAYSYHYKNSARRYIGWFFIALAQFGVVAALKKGDITLLLFATVMIFYWYVAKKWLLKKRAYKSFERAPLKDRKIEMRVDERGITQDEKLISWDQIEGVVPLEGGVMLYQQGREFYIPVSAFSSLEEMSRFKSIAKEKGKLYV